MGPLNVLMII